MSETGFKSVNTYARQMFILNIAMVVLKFVNSQALYEGLVGVMHVWIDVYACMYCMYEVCMDV